ncbi:hypothetical protein D3C77_556800 [compost metagenome]
MLHDLLPIDPYVLNVFRSGRIYDMRHIIGSRYKMRLLSIESDKIRLHSRGKPARIIQEQRLRAIFRAHAQCFQRRHGRWVA